MSKRDFNFARSRYVLPIVTFLACALTCVAYEAARIYGWYNRFGPFDENNTFEDIAFGKWGGPGMYLLIFLPFFVVLCNPKGPVIRTAWLILALVALVHLSLQAPGAVDGRWGNTVTPQFALFYLFILTLPAIGFVIFGLWKAQRNPPSTPDKDQSIEYPP